MIETCSNLSNKDKSFLSLAMKSAENSSCESRHGAVVVRSGRVLSVGFNKTKNTSLSLGDSNSYHGCTIHAEVDALSRVKNTKGCIVYVARINREGKGVMSRPCDNCWDYMYKNGVKKVVFTVHRIINI
jgi:deoxycytidylate deaminase